eukprot:CAMPEP_0170606862 /NCGR_PEP_ID=MMETSP0224-20130122/20747_1 /TAXON_ID=285029 /ORGANISM="Togula jolla, Strain CCCM 725" /LENGTH=334 /DNA_ID=CAMNT_0010931989 /DNA_START=48 /DNA_END=1052 /DNA_ORIENTATION=-
MAAGWTIRRRLLALLVLRSSLLPATSLDSPIIAVVTHPNNEALGWIAGEFIVASYVKFVEAAGGRAVALSYYATDAEVDHLASSVNGLLLPGGGSTMPKSVDRFMRHSRQLFEAKGENLPVWGSCLGFEWMVDHVQKGSIKTGFFAFNLSQPLLLTPSAAKSRLLGDAPRTVLDAVGKRNTTFNSHFEGISPKDFAQSKALQATYDVLATDVDLAGHPFVSTIEAKAGLPWYGVQWHPEKNTFEHGMQDGRPYENIPHGPDAVLVEQYVANFFISEARKSTQSFARTEDLQSRFLLGLPTSTDMSPGFEEIYRFRRDASGRLHPVGASEGSLLV